MSCVSEPCRWDGWRKEGNQSSVLLSSCDATSSHCEVQRHLPWYNADVFRDGMLTLDGDWKQNGLSSLKFKVLEETSVGIVRHVVVSLESH